MACRWAHLHGAYADLCPECSGEPECAADGHMLYIPDSNGVTYTPEQLAIRCACGKRSLQDHLDMVAAQTSGTTGGPA